MTDTPKDQPQIVPWPSPNAPDDATRIQVIDDPLTDGVRIVAVDKDGSRVKAGNLMGISTGGNRVYASVNADLGLRLTAEGFLKIRHN